MKTRLHHYYISDITTADGKAAYAEIVGQIDAQRHGSCHCVLAPDYKSRVGVEDVDLDPTYLFENQWNEAGDGTRRLFDWFEVHELSNKRMKRGHWLEITDEMHDARRQTMRCGYCGKLYGPLHDAPPARQICIACCGSEYLQEKDYPLLRVAPLGVNVKRPPLTTDELYYMRPIVNEAQRKGNERKREQIAERTRRRIAELREKAQEVIRHAENEANGRQWFFDRGFTNQENLIYYNHTRRFCWGWRDGLNEELLSSLLDVLSEFPYLYTVETADGRKLENAE